MAMCARLWRRLSLDGIRLEINTLGSAESRARYRARLVKYLESRFDELDEDGKRRVHANPLRVLDSKNPALQSLIQAAPRLYDDLDEDSLKHFEGLQAILRALDIDYEIRPRLVRGLDYYNHTVFEWTTERLGAQGAVCAGGRYDGLIAQLGGKSAPGCGFAMGVERLLALISEGARPPAAPPDAYLAYSGAGVELHAWRTAEGLRDAGLAVILHCGGGSFKSQLRKADASGARFAVIIGETEAAAERVAVKPLRELGEQVTVSLAGAVEMLQVGRARSGGRP
jgi:histidyl-tRNA synthetase